MTPQSKNAFGGFKAQGKDIAKAQQIMDDARRIEEAGAYAVVLECVPAKLAAKITENISIPTIGIGAGNGCDAQVLVYQDMLGLFSDFTPKFAKKFADVGALVQEGVGKYIEEVGNGTFPAKEHEFKIEQEVVDQVK
jgi:3-methyl-2-oxobutanoate hydroxymethyltransferase